MKIDAYEVNNGHVTAVFITDKKRNMKQHKYEPARPHGEWVHKNGKYRCSVCLEPCATFTLGTLEPRDNFCLWCGSDNRKSGDKSGSV